MMPFFPSLVFLLWLAGVVYGLVLATRFVNAVEQIARSMAGPPPGR